MRSWFFLFLILLLPFVVAEPCQENQQRQCGVSAIGACSYGLQICQGGQWSICYGNVDPVPEVCQNNIDDDCDGETDEACLCAANEQRSCQGSTIGICQPGYQTCINGTQWSTCSNQILPLANDLCNNNLDDDCDGQIDEGCAQQQNQIQQSTCFNNLQDGDETGVDCGGSCRTCATCTDGVLNQGEYKTSLDLGNSIVSDCGGPNCPSCPTCSDGVRNQEEQGIDCGGPCQACQQQGEEADEDQDGLTLAVELRKGTDPLLADTDGDGVDDRTDRYPLCPNTMCDASYGETEQNCPKDCASGAAASLGIVLLILFVLLVAIGGYLYYQFKHGLQPASPSTLKKEPQQPVYISKELLENKQDSGAKSKIDKDLEKSLEKVEKLFK